MGMRPLKEGDEIIVVSEGVYPNLDFKLGIIERQIKEKGRWIRYGVYFPDLDTSRDMISKYLVPVEKPTKEQAIRFVERGYRTLAKQDPEYKEIDKGLKGLWGEHREEVRNRREEAGRQHMSHFKEIADDSVVDLEGFTSEDKSRMGEVLREMGEGRPLHLHHSSSSDEKMKDITFRLFSLRSKRKDLLTPWDDEKKETT